MAASACGAVLAVLSLYPPGGQRPPPVPRGAVPGDGVSPEDVPATVLSEVQGDLHPGLSSGPTRCRLVWRIHKYNRFVIGFCGTGSMWMDFTEHSFLPLQFRTQGTFPYSESYFLCHEKNEFPME